MFVIKLFWWISCFIIFEAMIGYPLSLLVLNYFFKAKNEKKEQYNPSVSVMVVAHNEEKIILDKLNNLIELDYPIEKIEILVALDYCTDRTSEIVNMFIEEHPERRIKVHESSMHLGKTNAQNETQKLCTSEILVMTDANAMFKQNAVKELVSFFADPSIVYVTGRLSYINTDNSSTARSEGVYWSLDLKCREIESKIQTITAGNGAIYAVRNEEYIMLSPIECHDIGFPLLYALAKKRALYNPDAIAYERAGEVDEDEFKRKTRMNRRIVKEIMPNFHILNVIKYKWFSYFYFGHRTCRYLLWLMHLLALLLAIPLAIIQGLFWKIVLILQLFFYFVALIGWLTKCDNKLIKMVSYYCMTIIAQWRGVINCVKGQSKPIWDKAESTR